MFSSSGGNVIVTQSPYGGIQIARQPRGIPIGSSTGPVAAIPPVSGLQSGILTALRLGAQIQFRRCADLQGPEFNVYAKIPDLGTETFLGICGATQRAESEALIAATPAPKRTDPPASRNASSPDTWLSIVARKLGDLRADWSMMTEDARTEALAQIHSSVLHHM